MKSLMLITVVYHCVAFLRGDFVQHMKIDGNEREGGHASFKNCGERDSPIQLISLKINPQPIILGTGKSVNITIIFNITRPIGEPVKRVSGDVSIKIKDGNKYIELCPLLKWGTCHINDFCQWMNHTKHKYEKSCDISALLGFPCSCPVEAKTYALENLTIPITDIHLVVHGSFELLVALKDDVSVLGCVELKVCVNWC